jgi:hypothetical protein
MQRWLCVLMLLGLTGSVAQAQQTAPGPPTRQRAAQPAPAPPGAPQATQPSAVLTWQAYPATVTSEGTSIRRKGAGGGAYTEVGRVTRDVSTYTDATITVGQTYCWVVVGMQGTTEAPPSTEVCGGTMPAISGLQLRLQ